MNLNPGKDAMQDEYRTRARVGADGKLTLKGLPFAAGEQVKIIVLPDEKTGLGAEPVGTSGIGMEVRADALAILEALSGTIDAPSDWAAEHDHYLYGTPKRADSRR
jgi:hypothetical protein